jgi:hypothetical protein
MNAALNWLADRPTWALLLAWWALLTGVTAFTFIRIAEVCRDEELPPIPPAAPTVPVPPGHGPAELLTIDLGLYGPDLDALEASS